MTAKNTKEESANDQPQELVKVDKKTGEVDYSTMDQSFNKAITDRVDETKSLGKDAIVDKLKEYGFGEANIGADAAWLASKLTALQHAQLYKHELTPEGYEKMLEDFGPK